MSFLYKCIAAAKAIRHTYYVWKFAADYANGVENSKYETRALQGISA